jgi:hypothetical protein
MVLKEFIVVIQSPEGNEYELTVTARKESEAERRVRNLFDTINSRDKIMQVKEA